MFVVVADASELVMSQRSPLNCGATDPVQLPAVRQSLLPEVNVQERSVAKAGVTIASASKRHSAAKRDIRFPRGQNFSTKLACVSISDYGCTTRVRLISETFYLTAAKYP